MRKSNKDKITTEFYAIISEDAKSSILYIKGLLSYFAPFKIKKENIRTKGSSVIYTLNRANKTISIQIKHVGSSPKNIAEEAVKLANEKGTNYQKIFCIFDKDTHDDRGGHYTRLKGKCDNKKIYDISSVPSFEYWLYLHFTNYHAPISSSTAIEKMLRDNYLPQYEKSTLDFNDFKDTVQNAQENAAVSIERYKQDNSDNPMTYMGIFVTKLQGIIT